MPTPSGVIAEGPLTVVSAKTVTVPAVYELDEFGRPISPPLQGPTVKTVTISIGNRPDSFGNGAVLQVSDTPVDLGRFFTQKQIQEWHELKLAIENGLVTATVQGTVPWQPGY